jgi:hypothetical protein
MIPKGQRSQPPQVRSSWKAWHPAEPTCAWHKRYGRALRRTAFGKRWNSAVLLNPLWSRIVRRQGERQIVLVEHQQIAQIARSRVDVFLWIENILHA